MSSVSEETAILEEMLNASADDFSHTNSKSKKKTLKRGGKKIKLDNKENIPPTQMTLNDMSMFVQPEMAQATLASTTQGTQTLMQSLDQATQPQMMMQASQAPLMQGRSPMQTPMMMQAAQAQMAEATQTPLMQAAQVPIAQATQTSLMKAPMVSCGLDTLHVPLQSGSSLVDAVNFQTFTNPNGLRDDSIDPHMNQGFNYRISQNLRMVQERVPVTWSGMYNTTQVLLLKRKYIKDGETKEFGFRMYASELFEIERALKLFRECYKK